MNTVSALAEEGSAKAPPGRRSAAERSLAITRRTTLTFDSTGMARVGMIPRHGRAITEFADLSQPKTKQARVGHRALTAADLIAVATECLITEARRDRGAVGARVMLTHPACYTEGRVGEVRAALDAIGLSHVELVAEPVAAATWLEVERGPLMPGLALVYDLGGASLDITLVRVGAGRPRNPIVGVPIRSTDFGGRAFGALVAARAGNGTAPAAISGVTADELRTIHIRSSLQLVYRCLRMADVTMADVDCVLVVGGAARPVEVAQVLADELARPVITAPDPERTIADGAAILARRAAATDEDATGHHRRRRATTRALLLSRRTRRRLTRVAIAAGMSAAGVALALALPADTVVAGLSQLGLR
ncbi:Hsp70 family protein [Nocardia anaemiae]|uniref:Hsp70 family protein n=1 Tax=Nocardia anaemiae TaxID=263910 RepID=UPI001FE128DC|nr:Hsp70 family protein [Nocardia anaemiae]